MNTQTFKVTLAAAAFLAAIGLWLANTGSAHCDGLDGPVVTAAKKALDTKDVDLVLIWVTQDDRPLIQKAFDQALAVRKLSPEAKEMADMYFFETLVRVHRASEGAPYTGLKPAGRDLGPAIPAADRALEDGKIDPVLKLITDAVQDGIKKHYQEVMAKKNFAAADVDAGREYVESYVSYVHYIEGLYQAATASAEGHLEELDEAGAPAEKEQ